MYLVFALLVFLPSSLIIIFSEQIIEKGYQLSETGSSLVLIAMVITIITRGVEVPFAALCRALKKAMWLTKINTASQFVSLPIFAFLLPRLSLGGALLWALLFGSIISVITTLYVTIHYGLKRLRSET